MPINSMDWFLYDRDPRHERAKAEMKCTIKFRKIQTNVKLLRNHTGFVGEEYRGVFRTKVEGLKAVNYFYKKIILQMPNLVVSTPLKY